MPKVGVMLRLPDEALDAFRLARAKAEALLDATLDDPGPPHVTLLYVGDVPEAAVAEVETAARVVLTGVEGPLPLPGVGMGWFDPSPASDGRTPIIVPINDASRLLDGALAGLNERLLRALAPHVTAEQQDPYVPHVTLGYLPRALTTEEAQQLRDSQDGWFWRASSAELWADDAVAATFPFLSPRSSAGPFRREVAMSDTLHRTFLFVQRDAADPTAGSGDDARTKFTFVASEAVEDRYGDIVEQDWDLANYQRNPVVLAFHDGGSFPVGKGRAYLQDGRLMIDVEVDDHPLNPAGQLVAHQLRKGILNAGSVGFRSLEQVARNSLPAGDDRRAPRGMVLRRNELLEYSIVPIPALPSALAQRGLFHTEPDLVHALLDRAIAASRLRASADDAEHPMRAALNGMLAQLAGMPMSGDPDDDFCALMTTHHLGLVAASLGYLSVGKDTDMRKVASSMVKNGTDRVQGLQAWAEARAAARAGTVASEAVEPADGARAGAEEDPPVAEPVETPREATASFDVVAAITAFLDSPEGEEMLRKKVAEIQREAPPVVPVVAPTPTRGLFQLPKRRASDEA
jgi:2'-5' RNA ligase